VGGYALSTHTTWSPVRVKVKIAEAIAAMPDAKQSASSVCSSAASFCSARRTVGFDSRV
jgi:hypothetical protein